MQNYLFLARVIKSRNYVSNFASYCYITLILQLEGIKAEKHFQVEVPVPGNSALLLYNKQQTQRRGLLALSQAGRMRADLPVTQARPGACQWRVAYIQIYGKRGINFWNRLTRKFVNWKFIKINAQTCKILYHFSHYSSPSFIRTGRGDPDHRRENSVV